MRLKVYAATKLFNHRMQLQSTILKLSSLENKSEKKMKAIKIVS